MSEHRRMRLVVDVPEWMTRQSKSPTQAIMEQLTAHGEYSTQVVVVEAEWVEATAAAGEVERLRAWKAEAMTVLGDWEAVWEAAGRPGRLGGSKAQGVREFIEGRQQWEGTIELLGAAVARKRTVDLAHADVDPATFPKINVRDFLRSVYFDADVEYDPGHVLPDES